MPPRVSIIVNNYNYDRFLADAVESALQQTYENTEVIVVDDGSTDDSRSIIARYGSRITPVLKANGGQGSAYNAGFSVATGDVICFLDADDTLFPHAMQDAMTVMGRGRPAKVQWPLAITNASGEPTGELSTRSVPPEGDLRERVRRDGPLYDWYLTTGALYPRWMLAQLFPLPEEPYRLGSDEYLTTVAPVFGEVKNCPEPLSTYRNHGGNNYCGRELDDEKVHQYMRRFENNCAALQRQLQRFGLDGNPAEWRCRNFNYLWPQRLLKAKADIGTLVPEGSRYVLINDDEWGAGEPVPGRHAVPFIENAGEYWGPPSDDVHAIQELTRLEEAGVSIVVIWWTSFWWLDNYPRFAAYLRSRYECLLDDAHLMVFRLKQTSP